MTALLVATPAIDAGVDILVDWLELTAFFDQFQRARVDDIANSNRTQEETQEDDFGNAGRHDDQLREAIEHEVDARAKALQAAYPFELDGTGEELQLIRAVDDPRASFYLLCLIASHVTRSPLLREPPDDALVNRMRNRVFQVLGTLAVAGMVQGPAVSVGYPRETKETILDVLARAEDWGDGLSPRNKPGRHAAPRAKDGGVDVIGWPTSDRPPPPMVVFGQLASGQNWIEKPMTIEFDNFMNDFFEDRGTGQHMFATLIPFRVFDELAFQRASVVHRSICDRHRAPLYALNAIGLRDRGVPLDEIDNVGQIVAWLQEYRAAVLQDPGPAA